MFQKTFGQSCGNVVGRNRCFFEKMIPVIFGTGDTLPATYRSGSGTLSRMKFPAPCFRENTIGQGDPVPKWACAKICK